MTMTNGSIMECSAPKTNNLNYYVTTTLQYISVN